MECMDFSFAQFLNQMICFEGASEVSSVRFLQDVRRASRLKWKDNDRRTNEQKTQIRCVIRSREKEGRGE